ncbi:hypothetical protein HYT05_00855, partial [Candidatus Kaiserbacteria bacterium]|nr:hypothetical protein [Candidatus Kaiserbacteria bacterium]
IELFREEIHKDDMFLHQQRFIDQLLLFIKQEVGLTSTEAQIKVLREAIADRTGGIISSDDFQERLILPPDLDGAAYDERDAYLITRHLEKLIAQGGYIILPNELLGAHS